MSDKQLAIPERCGPCQQAGGKARRANLFREKMSKLRMERAWGVSGMGEVPEGKEHVKDSEKTVMD